MKSKQVLAMAGEVIIIQDKEGDIYEQFCIVPDERTNLKENPASPLFG